MSHPRPLTAVVTGASSGIGLAVVRALLSRGDRVVGNARDAARLARAARSFGPTALFVAVPGDVADPATAAAMLEQGERAFGSVDLLVNNAGIFVAKPFVDLTVDEEEALIATNLRGFLHVTRAFVRHAGMRGGSIVNVTASIASQPQASVPAAVPILIKGGIDAATRALAVELAPKGIRVNAVAPGLVDTPLHAPETREFLATMQPLGRIGTAEEIAEAVLHLADATFTTGVVLPVDGGMSAGRH